MPRRLLFACCWLLTALFTRLCCAVQIVTSGDGIYAFIISGNTVFRSINAGVTYNVIDGLPIDASWYSISTCNSGQYVLLTSAMGLYTSQNFGVDWIQSLSYPSGTSQYTFRTSVAISSNGKYGAVVFPIASYSSQFSVMYYSSSNYGWNWFGTAKINNIQDTGSSNHYQSFYIAVNDYGNTTSFADRTKIYYSTDGITFETYLIYNIALQFDTTVSSAIVVDDSSLVSKVYNIPTAPNQIQMTASYTENYHFTVIAASNFSNNYMAFGASTMSIFHYRTNPYLYFIPILENLPTAVVSMAMTENGRTIHAALLYASDALLQVVTSHDGGNNWSYSNNMSFHCPPGMYFSIYYTQCTQCYYGSGYDGSGTFRCTNEMDKYYNDGVSAYCNVPCANYPAMSAVAGYQSCWNYCGEGSLQISP